MGRRLWVGVLAGASAALIGAALSTAASSGVDLRAADYSSLGSTILVDGSGRPLYHLVGEKGKAIRCSASCAKTWPPIILAKGVTATAGPGVNRAKVGSIKRPDGRSQATYGGFALYRYSGDKKGTASGQGLGKAWYVISTAGRIITKPTTEPPAAGGTGGGSTGGGTGGNDPGMDTGGGYGY